MLEEICQKTNAFIASMPKELRKGYGQFFTSIETARFMASLFDIPANEKSISILDAGAGSGILSIAVAERILQENKVIKVCITCYENDPNVLPLLKSNLDSLTKKYPRASFEILNSNYIVSQKDSFNESLFATNELKKYDFVVGNPPYKKISKDAPEALAMPAVCHGAPNLYFLFAAMGIFNLKDEGELVYITPRSWTSGAYFESFRRYLVENTSIERIHLFESRTEVFDKESVLQETMIFKLRKQKTHQSSICISTTNGNGDFSQINYLDAPYKAVVSPVTNFIYLPSSMESLATLKKIGAFKNTLPSLGLKMKTGLVVDFRVPELLESEKNIDNVPLFYGRHIRDGKVSFPVGIENEYVSNAKQSLLQKNRNYLFVKRFTSKEEKRRLQSGIYLKRKFPDYSYISTQNKINFIDGETELSECTVYGLYVLFNSSLYDSYYRILNGSTQVNSTEINAMPVPDMDVIQNMGRRLIKSMDLSEANCNTILQEACA
ncbi:MAG: Eco57I restriction-modification methylase domain-containing protein [Fibrobacter sp.]|nr:Eco57I restriction-modification methylase domain-containing protein [Fibrobacter sp.]